jgi:cytochrome o ubiquinol oxidase subunit II
MVTTAGVKSCLETGIVESDYAYDGARLMPKTKRKHRPGSLVRVVILAAGALTLLFTVLLQGHNVSTLNPKGWVAHEQMGMILFSTVVLLAVALPSVGLLYFFAWKYRESNTKANHDAEMQSGKRFVVAVWVIPTVFMAVLSVAMWTSTHRLVPQQTIAAKAKPLTVEVVALRWKWLFIYPEQKIATVNFLQVPANTPVTLELTADDAPMSAFWIPNLGGMLYAMTGHVNKLNLLAQTPGDYRGSTAEINGAGFAGMKFTARVSSKEDFDLWAQSAKWYPEVLDEAEYQRLLGPSESNPPAFYSDYEAGLYGKVLMKYSGSHSHGGHE